MIRALLLCCLAYLASGLPQDSVPRVGFQERIVGGQEAEPHAYPWQVSLQYYDFIISPFYHTCGATIVDEYHVACAAHCIDGRKASHFQIIAGAHNIKNPIESHHQKIKIAEMWRHEDYDSSIITNDVSILKLAEPLTFNEYVQPMRMANVGEEPEAGTVCINSGWGSTSHSNFPSMPSKLQYVELPIMGREQCRENYSGINNVDAGMVCGGQDEGGISPCSGDSGGPLVCPDQNGEFYLAGIVSWGMIPCGQPKYPGVFTNVGHFREWMDAHIAM